jgi:hypothetical protein
LIGEPHVNFADKQFGVCDGTNIIDLLAIRTFSNQANYVTNDFVTQAGNLYVATTGSAAGAFVPANWNRIVLSTDSALFLPLTGGALSNSLTKCSSK